MSCCCADRRETVVADIEFNRSAVGINAKKDWEDADFFGQIGAQMSSAAPGGVALPLPAGSNEGTGKLGAAASQVTTVMRWMAQEFSDACALLGSGQETAISNNDETEAFNDERFQRLKARMEGGR